MLKRLHSLTVSQSMVAVFLSGFAVAVLFAINALVRDAHVYQAAAKDQDLLVAVRDVSLLIDEILAERSYSAVHLSTDSPSVAPLNEQRLRTDNALNRLAIRPIVSQTTQAVPKVHTDFSDLRDALEQGRSEVDAEAISAWQSLRLFDRFAGDLTVAIASSADQARSSRVATKIRDVGLLIAAKDALTREVTLTFLAQSSQDAQPSDSSFPDSELQKQHHATEIVFSQAILRADDSVQSELDLWMRSKPFRAITDLHRRVDESNSITDRAQALALQNAAMDGIKRIEGDAMARLTAANRSSMAAIRREMLTDLAILLGLFLSFGSVATLILRSINRSVGSLTNTICRLSVDVVSADIPDCPQPDLNQIASALRILKSSEIAQARSREEEEHIRHKIDAKLEKVLHAAETGYGDQRIEILGLDGHGATLARGINRLLDQIELDRATPPQRASHGR